MKKKISPALLCILAVIALILVCFIVMPSESSDPHAGHNHASGSGDSHDINDDHANESGDSHNANDGHNHGDAAHNKSAKESYELIKNADGTYSYQVISRSGHPRTAGESYATKPTVTEISQDVIKVSGQRNEKNNLSGWAIYYNVVGEGWSTRLFNYVLASTDNKVAFLAADQGNFYVTTCDPVTEANATRTELPGLTITQSGNPVIEYSLNNDGDLVVTYMVDNAEKSVLVKLN